jgi:hypothetical protein
MFHVFNLDLTVAIIVGFVALVLLFTVFLCIGYILTRETSVDIQEKEPRLKCRKLKADESSAKKRNVLHLGFYFKADATVFQVGVFKPIVVDVLTCSNTDDLWYLVEEAWMESVRSQTGGPGIPQMSELREVCGDSVADLGIAERIEKIAIIYDDCLENEQQLNESRYWFTRCSPSVT